MRAPSGGSAISTTDHLRALSRRDCLRGLAALSATCLLGRASAADELPYQRPFGPLAPWNVPVASLPEHLDSREMVQRLFLDLGGPRNARFHITIDSHTFAVYHTATAVGPTPIKTYWPGNLTGKIPWNPAWKPPAGQEAQVIVLDEQNGLEWDLSRVEYKLFVINASRANLVPGDYRTKVVGFPPSRGSGIPYLAMLVRPEEIRAGVIEHALSMTVANISGHEFVAPATKHDFARGGRAGIPAGTRFALRATDAELETWVERLPPMLSDRTRETARIIAVALRDYGWFVTDLSPGNLLQFESKASTGSEWEELGFSELKVRRTEYPRDLVDSLLTPDRIVAFVPSDQYPEDLRVTGS